MNTTQPEALQLAECCEHGYPLSDEAIRAAAELRRLHAYCQELESQVILDCMTHVQNPAGIEHVAGDVSKNGAGLNMSTQHARITELESQLAQRFDAADMATAAAQGFRDGATATAQPVAEPADTVVLNAAMRAIQQAIELIGAPTDERIRAVRRVLRGAVIVAEDAGKVAPQPSYTAQAADSVQEDAARYRWLREGNDAKHGAAWHVAVNLYGCEWDAAIDAARKQGASQ